MAKSRLSLDRLLNTPQLERIVPRLQPEILHQVIQHYGLEDCTELVALASPAQIERLLDADVWRAHAGGADDVFDVERFGLWLVVMMQSGASIAADKLAAIDRALVVAGLAGHIAVFDAAAVSSYVSLEGDLVEGRTSRATRTSELGGYVVETKDTPAWDAIIELLVFLDDERPDFFRELMQECVRQSSGTREADGFHDLLQDREQMLFDLQQGRSARRDAIGYVAAAQARAFLLEARDLRVQAAAPPTSFSARSYFRGLKLPDAEPSSKAAPSPQQPASAERERADEEVAAAAVVDMLTDAGVLHTEPRRLLGAPSADTSRLSFVQAHVAAKDSALAELAYLANTLLTGSSVLGRAFSPREASDAAAATCNLGLEHWPQNWKPRDLIMAFQVGWHILQKDISAFTARRLLAVLDNMTCHDREDQMQLTGLRRRLSRAIADQTPWLVREDLEVLLQFDATAWVGLRALLGECPVMNAAIASGAQLTIREDDFAFIANSRDVACVQQFVATLPAALIR